MTGKRRSIVPPFFIFLLFCCIVVHHVSTIYLPNVAGMTLTLRWRRLIERLPLWQVSKHFVSCIQGVTKETDFRLICTFSSAVTFCSTCCNSFLYTWLAFRSSCWIIEQLFLLVIELQKMWFARDSCLILSTFLNVNDGWSTMWNLCNIYDSFDIFNFTLLLPVRLLLGCCIIF